MGKPASNGRKTIRTPIITGREFKALRKSAGFTQKKFAALTGVAVSSINNWEYDRWPAPKWAVFILRLLAAKRQALITGQRPTLSTD